MLIIVRVWLENGLFLVANLGAKSSFVGVSACFCPQNDQFISFFTFFFFVSIRSFNLIKENQPFKTCMKKAPFKDRCILVKTHSYRQLKNTFCEQMHLCDFDRRNRPANLQFGMSGNEKIGLGDQELELGINNFMLGDQNLELGIENLELGIKKLLLDDQKFELGIEKFMLGDQNFMLGDQNLELGIQELELGSQNFMLDDQELMEKKI